MGTTLQEFVGLINGTWNPAARAIPGTRTIGDDAGAFAEMLWDRLKGFNPTTVREAMKWELMSPKGRYPDLRKLIGLCLDREPREQQDLCPHHRTDRSGVAKFFFDADDRSGLACHVCDSTGPINPEWFDKAARLCEEGLSIFPTIARQQLAPIYRRWAERLRCGDKRGGAPRQPAGESPKPG